MISIAQEDYSEDTYKDAESELKDLEREEREKEKKKKSD